MAVCGYIHYSPGIDAAVFLLTSAVLRLLAWYISRGIVKTTREVPTEALKIKSFNWSVDVVENLVENRR